MLSLISATQFVYLKFLEYYSNKSFYQENLRIPPIVNKNFDMN